VVPPGLQLPSDLQAFYAVAGGASLFHGSAYQFSIVAPSDFLSTNHRILGNGATGDVSDSWFTVATDGNDDYLSIDLGLLHLGRCYDSFHETHGLVGSTPVIALSFTDLLFRLLENHGAHPYWLAEGFGPLGEAYGENGEA
jgi:antitoxin YokJ